MYGAGRALRQQENCPGFKIKPHMLPDWERTFGKAPARWLVPAVAPLEVDRQQLDALVLRCGQLESPQDLQALLGEARELAPPTSGWESPFDLADPREHGGACLHLAAHEVKVTTTRKFWYRALKRDDPSDSYKATCLYLATVLQDDDFLAELLGSDDPLRPSRLAALNRDAAYFMTNLLGLAGREDYVPLLIKVLAADQHFVGQAVVLRALARLGVSVGDSNHSAARSISVMVDSDGGGLVIDTDLKYQGSSNCADCQFFPCHINRYYPGGIEDCKLWGRTDPAPLTKIADYRGWGTHLQVEPPSESPATEEDVLLEFANSLIGQQRWRDAIVPIFEALTAERELGVPLAWVLLAECMASLDERLFAHVCMREASSLAKLMPRAQQDKLQALAEFKRDQESLRAELIDVELDGDVYHHHAWGHRRYEDWLQALDFFTASNIASRGIASSWISMGEMHAELGELRLAELCMRKAAAVSRDTSLTRRFMKYADDVRERIRAGEVDPILDSEKRSRGDRTVRRLNTGEYATRAAQMNDVAERDRAPELTQARVRLHPISLKFENVTERAFQATLKCKDLGDYAKLAVSARDREEHLLAIEVLQIMVDHSPGRREKAWALCVAGEVLGDLGERYQRTLRWTKARECFRIALDYFAGAADLDPNEKDARAYFEEILRLLGQRS